MKSVLWVSADGLRVVDDKTKVGIWQWGRAACQSEGVSPSQCPEIAVLDHSWAPIKWEGHGRRPCPPPPLSQSQAVAHGKVGVGGGSFLIWVQAPMMKVSRACADCSPHPRT